MTQLPSRIPSPSSADIRELSDRYHLDLDDEEVEAYRDLVDEHLAVLERLDATREPHEERRHTDRDPGSRPEADPHNAIVRRCRVPGSDSGPLSGYTVGVKDNVSVAGVPMTCGTPVLDGYVPTADAFVVGQLLDAGATVTAKTNMDEMAVSGTGELGFDGPIVNPHSDAHLAGGSSGGSAVAVVTGDVDVAIGTDQAGSVRVPAAWCGCVGLKPTHGLVSYRGIAPLGHSFDHVGPLARTVSDTARTLQAVVGPDPLDPRQEDVEPGDYAAATDDPDAGALSVGLVAEGFDSEFADPAVDGCARDAVAASGVASREVSVPSHDEALPVALTIQFQDIAAMWESEGAGRFVDGAVDSHFAKTFAKARRASGGEFAPTVKQIFLVGGYLGTELQSRYYNLARNLRRDLRAAYDAALESVDLLAMPTTPMTAFERTTVESDRELVDRAQGKDGRGRNTMPFDMTGHPAISVPCGTVDGLPAGLMLVGRPFEEETVLRGAAAVERAVDAAPDLPLEG
ncbi:MAG: amidase family protein [Haloarculaceae archaeon]